LPDELQATEPEAEWRRAKEEAQGKSRSQLNAFRGLYSFLAQVMS
jgi:hypothetical protein